ncbi:DNA-binding MarR family transcriptional regulator [Nocardioides thalensis]|uniref:DNA-binding MarR family transcriptional regulator n=1 Tax=Nocardioides thalensis TaxID=1914755 RepID=A0A853C5S0_9ACTN|nr:MarR family transcriptional regulator [Nocardioides thalensis]NYJ02617.1 DNA-binding MarR family transcriptional regulator [Nocardioides thalensis]
MTDPGPAASSTAFAWGDTHLQQGWRGIVLGAALLIDKLDEDLRRLHKITFEEYVALVVLSESPDGMCAGNLAVGKAVHPSRLTRLVTHMQLAGWISRDSHAGRGTDAWVRITPKGRALVERAAPDHVASIHANVIDLVHRDDFLAVARLFSHVTDALVARHPELDVRGGLTTAG